MSDGGRIERAMVFAGWSLAVLALAGLALLWQLDRSRHREAPRWPAPGAVALRTAPPGGARPVETWAVVVHLGCAACRTSLAGVAATRERQRAPIRVAALLVDEPRSPARTAWTPLPAEDVWWDAGQRWRNAWGRRAYGEVLCFDSTGAFVRDLGPLSEPVANR